MVKRNNPELQCTQLFVDFRENVAGGRFPDRLQKVRQSKPNQAPLIPKGRQGRLRVDLFHISDIYISNFLKDSDTYKTPYDSTPFIFNDWNGE